MLSLVLTWMQVLLIYYKGTEYMIVKIRVQEGDIYICIYRGAVIGALGI